MTDNYQKHKEEFTKVCEQFDVHYTEDLIQEVFEDEADPYDYLYEMHGSGLESEDEDD